MVIFDQRLLLCIVFLSFFLVTNGHFRITGFNNSRWTTKQPGEYKYYFYDGELLDLFCIDEDLKTPGTLGWRWNEDSYVRWPFTEIRLPRTKLSKYNHNTYLTCIREFDQMVTYIRTGLNWDPNLAENKGHVPIVGFDETRWQFIETTAAVKRNIYKYRYNFYDGELFSYDCNKLKHYVVIRKAGIEKDEDLHLKNDNGPTEFSLSPAHHLKALICTYTTDLQVYFKISTVLTWNITNPKNSRSPYFTFEGFENSRLDNASSAFNKYTYYFQLYEKLHLTCKKMYDTPGYTDWGYGDFSLAFEEVNLQLNTSDSKQLTCSYVLNVNNPESVVAYYIDLQLCTEDKCPVEAEDKDWHSKGCNKYFYMSGLPELKWEGTDNCTSSLEYSEPLELDLTCVFLTAKPNIRIAYQPLRLFFRGDEKDSKELKENNSTVSAKVNINAEDNQQNIICSVTKNTNNGPKQQSLIIKLHHLPTTTSTTTNANCATVDRCPPLTLQRSKREFAKGAHKTATLVPMNLYLDKYKFFKCSSAANVILTEGSLVTTRVESQTVINNFTCSCNNTEIYTLKPFKYTETKYGERKHQYEKEDNVTKSLAGQWNCTVLAYKAPIKDGLPKFFKPKYNESNYIYLKTNCYINVTVLDPPPTTTTSTTTTSSTSTSTTTFTTTTSTTTTSTTTASTTSIPSTTTSNAHSTDFALSGDINDSFMTLRNGKKIRSNGNNKTKTTVKQKPATTKPKKTDVRRSEKFKFPKSSSEITTEQASSSSSSSSPSVSRNKILNKGTTTIASTTTTPPTPKATDETDPPNKDESRDDRSDPGLQMKIIFGVVAVVVLIVLVVVIVVIHRTCKQAKEEERQAINNEFMYENLSNDNSQQFPPNVENAYRLPYDTLNRPGDDSEVSPYAVANYTAKNDTYSVPYVEKDLNKLYAKPLPKNQRKELLYSKVVPKSLRQQECPYAEIQPKSQITYAEIETSVNGKNVFKPVEPTYSEVMSGYNNDYNNVVPEGSRYANAKDTEYAEPAYCELVKEKNQGNRRK